MPRELPLESPDQSRMMHPDYLSTTHDHFKPQNVPEDTTRFYQPDWVRLDRHVLRFYGYFKESVTESNIESYRIRRLVVCFYLEDNSLSINEERQENSGIPQGAFLKREKALKSNGRFFTPDDFRVGETVDIYGKNIHFHNCDIYTREFYEKQGKPQGPAEECPEDPFQEKANRKFVPVQDAEMKDYLEKKLGGGRVTSQKQFLENDRKVLKFFAVSECNYVIHYFLADDTIEIREVSEANSGKDPFPVCFRRQKLFKRFALNQPGQTYAEDFLRAEQIGVGKTIEVFGKVYHLVDCDAFTREYYRSKFNVEFPQLEREAGSSELKSSTLLATQTSSSLPTTASETRRTPWASYTGWCPSRPRRTSSSGSTSRFVFGSPRSSTPTSPRTQSGPSSSPTTSTTTASRSTSPPCGTPASPRASSWRGSSTRTSGGAVKSSGRRIWWWGLTW